MAVRKKVLSWWSQGAGGEDPVSEGILEIHTSLSCTWVLSLWVLVSNLLSLGGGQLHPWGNSSVFNKPMFRQFYRLVGWLVGFGKLGNNHKIKM